MGCHLRQDSKWIPSHMDACETLGISWPPPIPERLQGNEWFQAAPQREQEIVSIVGRDPDVIWVDASQNLARARGNKNRIAPTILPGCHLFHFPSNRFLIGADYMRLQGIPTHCLQGGSHSQSQLADLAGNAFSSSVALALDIAILCSVESLDVADPSSEARRVLEMCSHVLTREEESEFEIWFFLADHVIGVTALLCFQVPVTY